jgi:hypothetical protein
MNINYIMIGLMAVAVGLLVSNAISNRDKPIPNLPPFLVPIETGKTKKYVSMTRDAGMYTERTRRSAIIGIPDPRYGYKGSTNGSLEWNFLTSVCTNCLYPRVCPTIYETLKGGDAGDETCVVIDANGEDVLDLNLVQQDVC